MNGIVVVFRSAVAVVVLALVCAAPAVANGVPSGDRTPQLVKRAWTLSTAISRAARGVAPATVSLASTDEGMKSIERDRKSWENVQVPSAQPDDPGPGGEQLRKRDISAAGRRIAPVLVGLSDTEEGMKSIEKDRKRWNNVQDRKRWRNVQDSKRWRKVQIPSAQPNDHGTGGERLRKRAISFAGRGVAPALVGLGSTDEGMKWVERDRKSWKNMQVPSAQPNDHGPGGEHLRKRGIFGPMNAAYTAGSRAVVAGAAGGYIRGAASGIKQTTWSSFQRLVHGPPPPPPKSFLQKVMEMSGVQTVLLSAQAGARDGALRSLVNVASANGAKAVSAKGAKAVFAKGADVAAKGLKAVSGKGLKAVPAEGAKVVSATGAKAVSAKAVVAKARAVFAKAKGPNKAVSAKGPEAVSANGASRSLKGAALVGTAATAVIAASV